MVLGQVPGADVEREFPFFLGLAYKKIIRARAIKNSRVFASKTRKRFEAAFALKVAPNNIYTFFRN